VKYTRPEPFCVGLVSIYKIMGWGWIIEAGKIAQPQETKEMQK